MKRRENRKKKENQETGRLKGKEELQKKGELGEKEKENQGDVKERRKI